MNDVKRGQIWHDTHADENIRVLYESDKIGSEMSEHDHHFVALGLTTGRLSVWCTSMFIKHHKLMQDSDEDVVEALAGELYDLYCAQVGGVAFNGKPLPHWSEFSTDQDKTKQANAWRAVARSTIGEPIGV